MNILFKDHRSCIVLAHPHSCLPKMCIFFFRFFKFYNFCCFFIFFYVSLIDTTYHLTRVVSNGGRKVVGVVVLV